MTTRFWWLAAVCFGLFASGAAAQTPDFDKAVVDSLKEVHNRGAALYNKGDARSCLSMYQGALLAVKPLLAHRPAVQTIIDAGLTEAEAIADDKQKSFRLHEVIEKVREELKAKPKAEPKPEPKAEPKKEPMPAPKVEAKPEPKKEPAMPKAEVPTEPKVEPKKEPAPQPKAAGNTLGGTVTLDGKPLAAGAELTLVSLNAEKPRVVTAKLADGGRYAFDKAIPAGEYVAFLTGEGIPAKFTSTTTSPLRVAVADPVAPVDLNLATK